MQERYTDRRGRIHGVIHTIREEISPEKRRKISAELVRLLTEREKERTDGNRAVCKEIR